MKKFLIVMILIVGGLQSLLGQLRKEMTEKRGKRLAVRDGARTVFVDIDDIDWIEAAGNYVSIHVQGASFLMRATMADLERRLEGSALVRIHRSAIVNAARVREVVTVTSREAELVLRDGTRVSMSRRYEPDLQRVLGVE